MHHRDGGAKRGARHHMSWLLASRLVLLGSPFEMTTPRTCHCLGLSCWLVAIAMIGGARQSVAATPLVYQGQQGTPRKACEQSEVPFSVTFACGWSTGEVALVGGSGVSVLTHSGSIRNRVPTVGTTRCAALQNAGQMILVLRDMKALSAWEVSANPRLLWQQSEWAYRNEVEAKHLGVSASAQGGVVAVMTRHGLETVSALTGRREQSVRLHRATGTPIFSRSGSLVSVSSERNFNVFVVDLAPTTAQVRALRVVDKSAPLPMLFSLDEQLLWGHGYGGIFRVDLRSGDSSFDERDEVPATTSFHSGVLQPWAASDETNELVALTYESTASPGEGVALVKASDVDGFGWFETARTPTALAFAGPELVVAVPQADPKRLGPRTTVYWLCAHTGPVDSKR